MTPLRVEIQRRELDVAMVDAPESVLRRAAQVTAALLDGQTVVVEERIGDLPGGELMVEETILEAAEARQGDDWSSEPMLA